MKKAFGMHKAQVAVLHKLRADTKARYVELLAETDMTSDVFKFHIRKLVKLGYIEKNGDAMYRLTAAGKDYTNRLDRETGLPYEQPKSSLLLVVRTLADGEWRYIAHQRTREPFYGMWGIASARVPKGIGLLEAASKALKKQTGVETTFQAHGCLRVIDTDQNDTVLEDKLFMIMVAEINEPQILEKWCGGKSMWLTREVLLGKKKLFQTTAITLDMVENGNGFAEAVCHYENNEY